MRVALGRPDLAKAMHVQDQDVFRCHLHEATSRYKSFRQSSGHDPTGKGRLGGVLNHFGEMRMGS